MGSDTSTSRLLTLPDPCLLAVMQHCGNHTRSVISAATAHSRLQRAAVEALSSISAIVLEQHHVDSLLLYLAKHGQHVRNLGLYAQDNGVQLLELPPSLTQLDSLQLGDMDLQLKPGRGGTQGVLRAGFPLTRLELSDCRLLDGAQGLEAALMQLPDLQHLKVTPDLPEVYFLYFPTDVLPHLQKLTCLLLKKVLCHNKDNSSDRSAALQPLQALTRLADLQLESGVRTCAVTADTLSGAGQLTRLVLSDQYFEPRGLASKSQLQHLTLERCSFVPGAGVAQLLLELQHLTQLTHMGLSDRCSSCQWFADEGGPSPPPAAYASLTASSKLQHLDLSSKILPSAAWQYMCPPGRTLPHLRHLNICDVKEAGGSWSAPDTSALVSCCPGLQSLRSSMPCSTAQLAPLQRLTGLHTLAVGTGEDDELEGVQALCQLTGLQRLELHVSRDAEARILQLTQLTQLT